MLDDEDEASAARDVNDPERGESEGSDVSREHVAARADDVLTDALDQFSRNFFLNDLSNEQSLKLLEGATRDVTYVLSHREPRRRESVIEQVHQARVSVRRLRSTLRTFRDLYVPEWSAPMLTELSWYAAVLGEVRDLDVLRSSIAKSLWLIDDDRIQVIVSSRIDRQCELAQDRMAVERSTKRYACLIDDVATITAASNLLDITHGPALAVLGPDVLAAWRGVRKARRAAREEPNNENLHRLRIELKRVQCACEVVGQVAGTPALKVAKSAESNQKRLGVVHDESVAIAWLRALIVAESRLKPPLRAVMESHVEARRDAKRGWLDALSDVDRRWHHWGI